MLKAIETKYKGYRFRSRLEARWAVFFDAMGIEFQYEPQGFNLDGIKYLPDFLLPDLDLWIEIKGKFPTHDEQTKMIRLTAATPQIPLALFYGDPSPDHMMCWWVGKCIPRFMFCECDRCGTIGYITISDAIRFFAYRLRCEHKQDVIDEYHQNKFSSSPGRVLAACDAARSARFEHGEHP